MLLLALPAGSSVYAGALRLFACVRVLKFEASEGPYCVMNKTIVGEEMVVNCIRQA